MLKYDGSGAWLLPKLISIFFIKLNDPSIFINITHKVVKKKGF